MRKITLSLLMGFLAVTGLNAQTHSHNGRVCGAMEHLEMQLAQDPSLKERMAKEEEHTQAYIKSGEKTRVVVTIPVVVHILYKTTAENISDAQVNSQLSVLNADFRKLNADASLVPAAFASLAADCEVNFCLAQRTPTGAATTGIVRKATTVASWTTDDKIKYSAQGGDDAWDATKYLNLWVGTLGGGLLGYAQFPGTGLAATDGVVILNTAFGTTGTAAAPFNKGRTATHEVGHWLNLRHIWGDDGTACTGSDLVTDTPNQAGENYGTPTYPKTDACTAASPGVMFMNYMDYVDDAAMYMFTAGQKARMQAVLVTGGSRAGLASSLGCQAPTTATCAAPTGLNATSITTTGATVNWGAVSGATSYTLQYKTSAATTWTTVTGITTTSKALTGLTAGTTYNYQVLAVCSSTSSSAYTAATFTTTSATATCNAPTGLTASSITTTGATVAWTAVTGATSYTLQYKTSAATTWTTVTGITTTSKALTGLTAGTTYNYQVLTVCSSTSSSAYTASTFTTTAAGCTDVYETNETAATAKTITANTNVTALIGTSTDVDWFKFTTTSTAPKVKITLTTLPADYDVTLYSSNGTTVLGSSANAGTTSESIIYNTSTAAATYYVKVFGYSGALNTTSCYTLKAATGSTNFVRGSSEFSDGIKEVMEDVIVYPNPVNGMATVRLTPTNTDAGMEIAIFDQMGRIVNAPIANSNEKYEMNVDFSNVTAGVYFVRVTNGENISTKKIVVAH